MKEPPAVSQILSTALEYERMAATIEKLNFTKVDRSDRTSRAS
jgi:hypothetical protein